MMQEFYVIHSGTGTDGGFGDYSPPRWSKDPVTINGEAVWLARESDAELVVSKLNQKSRDVFYESGKSMQYDGVFPVEYEYRRIRIPDNDPFTKTKAVDFIEAEHGASWQHHPYLDEDDDYDDCWAGDDE